MSDLGPCGCEESRRLREAGTLLHAAMSALVMRIVMGGSLSEVETQVNRAQDAMAAALAESQHE